MNQQLHNHPTITMQHPCTVADALAAAKLLSASDTGQLDGELLLSTVLGLDRVALRARPERSLSAEQTNKYETLLHRRATGEPVAYLTGRKAFWNFELEVTPAVLIPRPETELLVEQALAYLQGREEEPLLIADLGTGSGAIALALAAHSPHWQIIALDISTASLEITQRNAQHLNLNNVKFMQATWCDSLPAAGLDLIVSNPPYVAANDPHLQANGLMFEPQQALVAADEGLADLQTIITQAGRCLKSNADNAHNTRNTRNPRLILEHGMSQAAAVTNLLEQHGYHNITTHTDLAGHERVTSGCWQS
ncbi:MAG: peptide chain release factor N(5)-glutamine methyltransferase [Pseudohongiellaceae bacterium]